jgi:hypothetical protein
MGFMTRNLGFPNAEYESVVYRPRFFRFHETGGVIRHIELTWKSGGSNQGIHLGAFMRPWAMKS